MLSRGHPLFQRCDDGHEVDTIDYDLYPSTYQLPWLKLPVLALAPDQVQVVVSHFPCLDGYAAALVAYMYNPHIEIILTDHAKMHTHHDALRGKNVLFLDISPTRDQLALWTKERLMANFVVIDHHASSRIELMALSERHKYLDMNFSGCVLAFVYFFGTDWELPLLLRYIQARDLFRKDKEGLCDIVMGGLLATCGYCAGCWSKHLNDVHSLVEIGTFLEKQRQKAINAYVSTAQPRIWNVNGVLYRTWIVNCTDKSCISDTGNRLVSRDGCDKDIAFMFRYEVLERQWHISLRSLSGVGPDVSVIAQDTFGGGGGHANAAGLVYHGISIESIFE